MFSFIKKKFIRDISKERNLTKADLGIFYTLLNKLNPISGIIGIITKDFETSIEYIDKKYDKTFTKIANAQTKTIVVVKEDFLIKYVVLETLEEVINSNYKFCKYI